MCGGYQTAVGLQTPGCPLYPNPARMRHLSADIVTFDPFSTDSGTQDRCVNLRLYSSQLRNPADLRTVTSPPWHGSSSLQRPLQFPAVQLQMSPILTFALSPCLSVFLLLSLLLSVSLSLSFAIQPPTFPLLLSCPPLPRHYGR